MRRGTWPSTCTGLNQTLTIQDATGTTTLFLDKDTPLCGSPNPSGPFDVIGILTQFDSTAPYFEGYQIKPRFLSDVIPITPGPNFTGAPTAVPLDSTSATVSWGTDVPSTSIVHYGTTTGLGSTAGDSTVTNDGQSPFRHDRSWLHDDWWISVLRPNSVETG